MTDIGSVKICKERVTVGRKHGSRQKAVSSKQTAVSSKRTVASRQHRAGKRVSFAT